LILNPLLAYATAGALLLGVAGGWTLRDWKADSDTLKAMEKREQVREDMQAKVDAKAKEFEDWRSRQEPARIETRNTIRETFRNVEVPAQCAAPDVIVSLLEARTAAANLAVAGQFGAGVPAAAASTQPAH